VKCLVADARVVDMFDPEPNLINPRLEDARSYLADWLGDEDIHGEASLAWFAGLADYARELPLSHPLTRRAAVFLQPFLEDDERVEGAMYPGGKFVQFIQQGWGGDYLEYLTALIDALGYDFLTWQAMLFEDGDAAIWRYSGLEAPLSLDPTVLPAG
jgi:hypothetical protein